MAGAVAWVCVVLVGPHRATVTTWVVGGSGRPDLATVDTLARSQLFARRLGGSILLRDACEDLESLLDLAGLRREVGGQPEPGEEGVGVEEGVEPGDPPA